MAMFSPFIPVLAALVVGLALGVLAAAVAGRAAREREREGAAALGQELATLRVAQARTETELAGMRGRQGSLEEAAAQAVEEHRAMQRELSEARVALGETTTQLAAERASAEQRLLVERAAAADRLDAEREAAASRLELERCAADEKLLLLAEARVELGNQFKTLAGEIFDEKSKRFGEQNQASMDMLLAPLREKLGEFQQRVEGFSNESRVGRGELRTHIETLSKLNDRLSAEASSLASALKGSSKKQGDWGEVLLERMLEDSGLRAGHEYRVQESLSREDGTRARPDVILNLPGEKHLVIDAKVSLVDYNAYCECEDEGSRGVSLARHVGSLRAHIRGLKKREYQVLYQLQSIDFVVMFVPIEPAYLLALSKDGRLWQEAWEKDVLLVSPGTLFPVIRTVAHLWRQEQQNRNVQEIVYRGGELYDKLAAFAGDVVKIGDGLDVARTSYDRAMSKLKTGKGNVIRQAELLKGLGVKPSKQMPKELLDALGEEFGERVMEGSVGSE
jgi:DNA recombination protein RmuC